MNTVNDLTPDAVPRRSSREQVIGDGITWLSRWSLRWLLIALAAALLGLIVREFWTILLPVILALIVTTVLQPPAWYLERRLGIPTAFSAAVVLLGSLAIVVLGAVLLAPTVSSQSGDIASDASKGLTQIQDWVNNSNLVSDKQIDGVVSAAQDRLKSSASSIASGVLVGVSAVTSALVTLLITLILTFFFLKDGRRFAPWMRGLTGARAGAHLVEVSARAWVTLGGFIRTQALVSLIDAVLIGAALVIVQVPLAIPLAILTFFGGFIPIVGAIAVGAVAVLVALVSNGVTGALIILGVIVAVQQLEGNVLSPMLQSKSSDLHAGVVLLAIALGSTLFGIIGAFLAVPVVATLAVILRYLNEIVAEKAPEERPAPEDLPEPPGVASAEGTAAPAPVARQEPAIEGSGSRRAEPLL
jgi:predicted PurR-regulated permease PerM